jgi:hypothetical protein
MVLIRNKRGIFFTLLSIVIISIFIVSFIFISGVSERRAVGKRIESLNDFVSSVEEDLPRQLFISGFRIIFLFEREVVENGNYINNLDDSFDEVFFNWTLNGVGQDSALKYAFDDIENALRLKAKKINANVSLTNPVISVSQDDPWNVKVTLVSDLVIRDEGNLAFWNKSSVIVSYIPVQNFDDPIYLINTNGLVSNKVIRTPYTTFVSGSDVSNLLDHAANSYYDASIEGPSFLDRLQGLTGANANGIESMVNLQELSGQGMNVLDKSVVDHIYFSTGNPGACNVLPTGMPSWFKLDSGHLAKYEVSCV